MLLASEGAQVVVNYNKSKTEAHQLLKRIDEMGSKAVVIQAEHLCMIMRGIEKPGSNVVTSALRGLFQRKAASRAEFFSLIQGK